MLPLSFTPAERLKTDSIKSPVIPAVATAKPNAIPFNIEPVKISVHKRCAIIPAAMEPAYPPINPAMLLFGLHTTRPRLFFPNSTPKNHASESHINTENKKTQIKIDE